MFRGNTWFLAFGGIYFRSATTTAAINSALRAPLPGMSNGLAFVRLGAVGSDNGTSVLIEGMGRFGNSIAQVLNALEVARHLDSLSVLYHRFDAVRNRPLALGHDISLKKLPLVSPSKRSSPRTIWRTSAITPAILFCNPCEEWFNEPRLALRDATSVGNFSGADNPEDLKLTIHIRGGDVFSNVPEEMYGQPPWAFYQRVLESEKWNQVVLVTEDENNPVVAPIAKWCAQNMVSLLRTGESFLSAIEAISKGSHLVGSTGTFLGAITYLSGGSRVLFQFDEEVSPFVCRQLVKVHTVRDEAREYVESVMSENWKNTHFQRQLMVSYPISKVSGVIGPQG